MVAGSLGIQRLKRVTERDQKELSDILLLGMKEVGFQHDVRLDANLNGWQREYIDSGGIIDVLRDGERIVGCVAAKPVAVDTVEVTVLRILRPYQGKGFGKKLMHGVIQYFQSRKSKWLCLNTNTWNVRALKLFRDLGFTDVRTEGKNICLELDIGRTSTIGQ
jgi:ribosomal protein S18 acetylase RimI-like enzyme